MSYSYTLSDTITFTLTHAKHLAAKIATDLKRLQRLYGQPSDTSISNYEVEITELLKGGYFGTLTIGFKRDGQWIEPALCYTARDLVGISASDDDPGRIRPGANITGATFGSFLIYSAAWGSLTQAQRASFQERMPFYRSDAPEPGINGYLTSDRTYSAGGCALDRSSVRSYS